MALYWLRLKQGLNTKIAYRVLSLCQRFHDNADCDYSFDWMESIKQTLAAAGLEETVWKNDNVTGIDSDTLKRQLWAAARVQFGNKWSGEVMSSRTCETYKTLMPIWTAELPSYLTSLNFYQRRAVARFRCRSNFLPMSSFLKSSRLHPVVSPLQWRQCWRGALLTIMPLLCTRACPPPTQRCREHGPSVTCRQSAELYWTRTFEKNCPLYREHSKCIQRHTFPCGNKLN